jgi:hypothetical protein
MERKRTRGELISPESPPALIESKGKRASDGESAGKKLWLFVPEKSLK